MKNHPKLSIIIPVYNMGNTLERCISFVLNQSYKNYELLIIDDCSTDNTGEIIGKYVSNYPNTIIGLKTESNGGPGHARNIGLKKATGKYVSFIDADDWIDSSLYSTVIPYLEQEKADVAVFGVKDEYETPCNSKTRYYYPFFNIIDNKHALNLLSHLYNYDSYITPMVCPKIFKREIIEKSNLQFKEKSYFEDDLFTFILLSNECKILIVPDVYYHYYQNKHSITHTFSKKHLDDLVVLCKDLKEYLDINMLWDKHKEEYFSFCKKCIRNTINTLFITEHSIQKQKECIIYFLNIMQENFDILEWINHVDISIIKKCLMY